MYYQPELSIHSLDNELSVGNLNIFNPLLLLRFFMQLK